MSEYSKEIVETYWNMMGVTEWKHSKEREEFPPRTCTKCQSINLGAITCPIPDPITLSPWELAGFMRDKLSGDQLYRWQHYLIWEMEKSGITIPFQGGIELVLSKATPQQWIKAAVAAWENKK